MPLNHINNRHQITFLTNDNWTFIDFENFIRTINNIYHTLYSCDIIINLLKNKNESTLILEYFKKNSISEYIIKKNIKIRNDYILYIKSIHMASPGEIVLSSGIGEILHELREFIKDLSYRNQYEKNMCRLNIIEKKLEIMKKYDIMERELESLLLYINGNCFTLINLQNKGLLNLGNFVDFEA
jgi:antitoxin component YwqK of YwqJK toxin-antitoxin module